MVSAECAEIGKSKGDSAGPCGNQFSYMQEELAEESASIEPRAAQPSFPSDTTLAGTAYPRVRFAL